MSRNIQYNTTLDGVGPKYRTWSKYARNVNQEGHVMLNSHKINPASINLTPTPGLQFDDQYDESSPTNIRNPGADVDRVPLARRSTHLSAGAEVSASVDPGPSVLPVWVKGISSGREDEFNVGPWARALTGVGSVFFDVPQNQFVRSPVAFATLWLSQINMTVVTSIFRGRHLVPGITSKSPLVSAAIQKWNCIMKVSRLHVPMNAKMREEADRRMGLELRRMTNAAMGRGET